jgi:hypothetical protein
LTRRATSRALTPPKRSAARSTKHAASSASAARDQRSFVRKNGVLVPAVVQLPTRPRYEYTARERREAIDAARVGLLRRAADLNRAAIGENGVFSGLVNGIAHGILGLPLSLQGDPEMRSALLDEQNSTGDFGVMLPESEASEVFIDGMTLGVGLGQRVEVMGTGPFDVMRPIGERSTPRLRRWDPRWLRQDPHSRKWYLLTQSGEIEISPNDEEWVFFLPYGDTDPWLRAPWLYLTLSFVFGRDATMDRQRHSEVLSPTRILRAKANVRKEALQKAKKKLEAMARDNYFVLPPEWIYEIVETTGRITDLYAAIIAWAERQAEIGLTGNTVTTEGTKGFSEGTIHQRIARDRLRFYASTWFRAIRDQVLSWWSLRNYGTNQAPTGGYNVDPPDEILERWRMAFPSTGSR